MSTWNDLSPFRASKGYVIEKMLEKAGASEQDVVYDLGSGTGDIIKHALLEPFKVKRAVGIEINKGLADKSIQLLQLYERMYSYIQGKWEIINDDVFNCDVSEANIVTAYLTLYGNDRIMWKLKKELSEDTLVVTNTFEIENWKPIEEYFAKSNGSDDMPGYPIYVYKMSEI